MKFWAGLHSHPQVMLEVCPQAAQGLPYIGVQKQADSAMSRIILFPPAPHEQAQGAVAATRLSANCKLGVLFRSRLMEFPGTS